MLFFRLFKKCVRQSFEKFFIPHCNKSLNISDSNVSLKATEANGFVNLQESFLPVFAVPFLYPDAIENICGINNNLSIIWLSKSNTINCFSPRQNNRQKIASLLIYIFQLMCQEEIWRGSIRANNHYYGAIFVCSPPAQKTPLSRRVCFSVFVFICATLLFSVSAIVKCLNKYSKLKVEGFIKCCHAFSSFLAFSVAIAQGKRKKLKK